MHDFSLLNLMGGTSLLVVSLSKADLESNSQVDCNTFVRVCRKYRFFTFEVHAFATIRNLCGIYGIVPAVLYKVLIMSCAERLVHVRMNLQVGPQVRKTDPAAKEVFDSLEDEWGKFDRTVVLIPCLRVQYVLVPSENSGPFFLPSGDYIHAILHQHWPTAQITAMPEQAMELLSIMAGTAAANRLEQLVVALKKKLVERSDPEESWHLFRHVIEGMAVSISCGSAGASRRSEQDCCIESATCTRKLDCCLQTATIVCSCFGRLSRDWD